MHQCNKRYFSFRISWKNLFLDGIDNVSKEDESDGFRN